MNWYIVLGLDTYAQFKSQMAIYMQYLQSGLHQQRYGSSAVRVLVVTTTRHRRDQLRERTRQVGGKQRFWFTTREEASRGCVLTRPIWVRATETSRGEYLMPLP